MIESIAVDITFPGKVYVFKCQGRNMISDLLDGCNYTDKCNQKVKINYAKSILFIVIVYEYEN